MDFTVDQAQITQAKRLKADFLKKLQHSDADQRGQLRIDQIIQIGERFQISFSQADLKYIREKLRPLGKKVDYMQVYNLLKLSISEDSQLQWVVSRKKASLPKDSHRGHSLNDLITLKSSQQKSTTLPTSTRNVQKLPSLDRSLVKEQRQGSLIEDPMSSVEQMGPTSIPSYNRKELRYKSIDFGSPSQKDLPLPQINKAKWREVGSPTKMSYKQMSEIKEGYCISNLDIKQIFSLKWQLSRKEVLAMQFDSEEEFSQLFKGFNFTTPQVFVSVLYKNAVQPNNGRVSIILLKHFVEICQDSTQVQLKGLSQRMKTMMAGQNQFEFSLENQKLAAEVETKLDSKHYSLRNAFRTFDLDKDGFINEDEFLEGLLSLNIEITEQQVHSLFCDLDIDRRNLLNFDQFCNLGCSKPALDLDRISIQFPEDQMETMSQMSRMSRLEKQSVLSSTTKGGYNQFYSFKIGAVKGKQSRAIELYDRIEEERHSEKKKRKLKILDLSKAQSPTVTFGKKILREDINKVLTYEYLNEELAKKLRDRFSSVGQRNKHE